jgi:hypothetical protein
MKGAGVDAKNTCTRDVEGGEAGKFLVEGSHRRTGDEVDDNCAEPSWRLRRNLGER